MNKHHYYKPVSTPEDLRLAEAKTLAWSDSRGLKGMRSRERSALVPLTQPQTLWALIATASLVFSCMR